MSLFEWSIWDRFAPQLVIHHLWLGVLVALLVAAADQILSRSSAANRYRISAAAFWLIVLMPALTIIPRPDDGVRPLGRYLEPSSLGIAVPLATNAPADDVERLPPPLAGPGDHRSPVKDVPLGHLVLLAWAAIASGQLISLALALAGARRLRRGSRTWTVPARMGARLTAAGVDLERLRVSSAIDAPIVVGPLRPVILLPAGLTVDDDRLVQILVHEQAHIDRRDPQRDLVQRSARALLWFHPAVHWLSRRMDLYREQACDDCVLRRTGQVAPYARILLLLARGPHVETLPVMAIAGGRTRSQLGLRIGALADERRSRAPDATASLFGTGLGLAAATVAFGLIALPPASAIGGKQPEISLWTPPNHQALAIGPEQLAEAIRRADESLPAAFSPRPQLERWQVLREDDNGVTFEVDFVPYRITAERTDYLQLECTNTPVSDQPMVCSGLKTRARQRHPDVANEIQILGGLDEALVASIANSTRRLFVATLQRESDAVLSALRIRRLDRFVRGVLTTIEPTIFVTADQGRFRAEVVLHPSDVGDGPRHRVYSVRCIDLDLDENLSCQPAQGLPPGWALAADRSSSSYRGTLFSRQLTDSELAGATAAVRADYPEYGSISVERARSERTEDALNIELRFAARSLSPTRRLHQHFDCAREHPDAAWRCAPSRQHVIQIVDEAAVDVLGRVAFDEPTVAAMLNYGREVLAEHRRLSAPVAEAVPIRVSADCFTRLERRQCRANPHVAFRLGGRIHRLIFDHELLAEDQFRIVEIRGSRLSAAEDKAMEEDTPIGANRSAEGG